MPLLLLNENNIESTQPIVFPMNGNDDSQPTIDSESAIPEQDFIESPTDTPIDSARFEKEMLPHIKALYHFALRLTSNEDDANDLVQDTYLKAFRFFGSYESGSNAKAWLFRILKNSFINNYRKVSKEPNKMDYEEAENFLNTNKSTGGYGNDLRENIFKGLIGDEVSRALNSLPVDFRIVIILCDIEEFTYEEISKIIDIPIGTVRSRLHRARKMLRELLLPYALSMGYSAT
jgi:RNA polymerase sigma factor (sigma-70 family)